ncbi:MAG: hypothetical protein BI182_02055 [Acetobacterium sp. MES1]|uniref:hypothetical protein n=1 Tax=Acetobacterium sp. MES1 TaxID=1899015 RepID=UPI000B9CB0D0|nr:hypothetical protein [Acetobacterium sp. MES1]OXS26516.1 MAG: hypothetical protein BI182_02055 [Acetobacterium sp. MES1]
MRSLKYKLAPLGAALVLGLLLGGCGTATTATNNPTKIAETTVTTTVNPAKAAAAQAAMKFYLAVTLDQPRAQLEAMLAVPGDVQDDGQVAYRDPANGYGVLIRFGEDDAVFAKRLLPAGRSPELAVLNPFPVTDKQAYRMAVGMPFYEVQDVMGSDGIEVSLSKPEAGSTRQVTGLGWFNPDGSYAVVYLNLPQGLVVGSEFVAGPA